MKKPLILLNLLLLCVSTGRAESYALQALNVSDEKGTWERLPHPVLTEKRAIKLSTRDRSQVAVFTYFKLPDIAKTEADESAFLSGMEKSIVSDKSVPSKIDKIDIAIDGIPARLYKRSFPKDPGRETVTVIFIHQRNIYYIALQSKTGKTTENQEIRTLFSSIKLAKTPAD